MISVPGRNCGSCTLRCKVYEIAVLAKPPGRWCGHCKPGAGCGIHAMRPDQCRAFNCLWLEDPAIPEDWKPEKSKFVLTIFPGNGFLYVQVDPGAPQAWRRAPYFEQLKKIAGEFNARGKHVIVSVNDFATLILPTGPVTLGAMSAKDHFRIEQTFGPEGPTYRAVRD